MKVRGGWAKVHVQQTDDTNPFLSEFSIMVGNTSRITGGGRGRRGGRAGGKRESLTDDYGKVSENDEEGGACAGIHFGFRFTPTDTRLSVMG
jgi:hypothetical protein